MAIRAKVIANLPKSAWCHLERKKKIVQYGRKYDQNKFLKNQQASRENYEGSITFQLLIS